MWCGWWRKFGAVGINDGKFVARFVGYAPVVSILASSCSCWLRSSSWRLAEGMPWVMEPVLVVLRPLMPGRAKKFIVFTKYS